MKVIASIVGCILVILIVGFLIQGYDFFLYKTFAPAYEGVRRNVFEESKSYNQGMIQELQNMQFQYEQTDPEHKAALAGIILHRAAAYPEDKMPPDLVRFIQKLKTEQRIAR